MNSIYLQASPWAVWKMLVLEDCTEARMGRPIIAAGQSVMEEGKEFAQEYYDAIREEGLRIRRVYSRVSILMSCQRESAIAAA